MKRVFFALVGLAALTGTAAAADLPRPAPQPYYKAPVVAPVFSWTGNINGTTNTACPFGCKTTDNWLSTVRGRLGYAADRVMPFVTAGAAFGDIRASTPGFAGANTTNAGWTVGGGIEFAFAQNWSAKAEYLYVDLGKLSCGLSCGVTVTDNVSFTANIVRAGVNYHF